uniref:Trimethylguanosine synthase n=1 Tax=Culex tarsalis TaxID=7177 RepID=A0A1Q3F523_CULTA
MSSSEAHWEPLAEIYLSYPPVSTSGTSTKEQQQQKECTYCLCSRVFIRNYYDVYVSTLERGDPLNGTSGVTQVEESPSQGDKIDDESGGVSKQVAEVVDEIEDDVFSEEPLKKQLSFGRSVVKWDRCDGTASDASCYFSASASHSDTNYCSTDDQQEGHVLHGALMAQAGLHSSDSGADISEKNFEPKAGGGDNEDLFVGMREALLADEGGKIASLVHVERNNSLPEVFGREDLQEAWESHWNKHGESIIWASWIEKYSDYINPEYMDHVPQQDTNCNSPHSKSEATPDTTYDASKHFSFDTMEAEVDPKVTTEIVVSTCSPRPSSCNDGWNNTVDDIWTSHRSADNDALLSPRCDSVTSSIPLTIGTTDSMTNVTRMTISSYDFGSSSKVSSESSNLSESSLSEQITSESASSNSSDMLATECLVGAATSVEPSAGIDEEAAMDGEQYWQILWQKHFQELYATHYNLFMTERSEEQQTDLRTKLHKRKRNSSSGSGVLYNKSSAAEQLPEMVAQLKLELSSPLKKDNDEAPQDGGETDNQQSSTNSNTNQQQSGSDHGVEDISSALEAYGLPMSFGKPPAARKTGRTGNDDDDDDEDPPADRSTNLKRSHESDTEETPNDRLKAAFELMGYAFSDPANRNESADSIINITGEVVYRKKHIRLHNRVLKMKHHKPPRHTYFDDDGNEVPGVGSSGEGKGGEAVAPEALMHTSSDEDDPAAGGVAGLPRSVSSSVRSSAVIEYNPTPPVGRESQEENEEEVKEQPQQESENVPSEEPVDEVCDVQAPVKKEKKKKRKPKFVASLPPEIANDKSLLKYWYKRFSLFSLFDAGIKLDRESWFSVTPEKVAAHTAERCRSDLVVDGFCGCGGNSIQLAFTCNQVIAIDIDPKKIEMAKHNAAVYGVADRIEFIVGDFLALADRLRADAVFLSPPWGGPSYLKDEVYDLETSLIPVPATELMRKARQISPNVALYLPRNSNTQQLTMLAGPNNAVEIEQNFLDRKLIALTAYYGELINE